MLVKRSPGLIVNVPEKPKKEFPKIREYYKLPSASNFDNSFLNLSLIDLSNSGRKGISITNKGVLPVEGNDITWYLCYTWWQDSEPTNKTYTQIKLNLNSGSFGIKLEAIPNSTYEFYLLSDNAGKTQAFKKQTIITPEDYIYTKVDDVIKPTGLS